MRLSSRRIWCALLLLLVLISCMLVDPIARGAKQLAVRCIYGGTISVDDYTFHRKQELLEIDSLNSAHVSGLLQVNLATDRALIKIETPDLVDKRLISPKSKLEGVRLELVSFEPAPNAANAPTVTGNFRDSVNAVLTTLRWDVLRADCEALLTADDVLKELDSKLRSWMLRSQQIMFHADQLTTSVETFSNPLRHAAEIRNRMKQLEQLRSEQTTLQQQFQGLNETVAQQVSLIQSANKRDIDSLRAKTQRESDTLRNAAAEQLVRQWTLELLDAQCKLAQSMSIVFEASSGHNPLNVNVRDSAKQSSLVSMQNIETNGTFVYDNKDIGFSGLGEYQLMQKPSFAIEPQTAWTLNFRDQSTATQVMLNSQAYSNEWTMLGSVCESARDDQSPSHRDLNTDSESSLIVGSTDTAERIFEINAKLSGSNLAGIAKLNASKLDVLKQLPCACNADLKAIGSTQESVTVGSAFDSDEQWIEMALSGTAIAPQIELKESLPKALVDALTERIQSQLEQQRIDSESKLAAELESKVTSLKSTVDALVEQGLQNVVKQQATLADMQSQLEQNLQSRESYEYARRPTLPTSNR